MNRKGRRRTKRGRGGLVLGGPRWTLLASSLRRGATGGRRLVRQRGNELLITALYAIAGSLCLALAALLITGGIDGAATTGDRPGPSSPSGPGLSAGLPAGLFLGVLGLVLLGAAGYTFWGWLKSRG